MIRSLFRLITFVAIAILYACAAPLQTTSAPGPTGVTCAGSDVFLAKVSVLTLPFFPNPNDSSYKAPSGTTLTNSNILSDLVTAFCHANATTRDDLIGLTAVFINPCTEPIASDCGAKSTPTLCSPNNNPNDCSVPEVVAAANSWGYRDRNNAKYIATSAGLWPNGARAPSLDQYEKYRIQAALVALSRQYGNPSPDPSLLPTYDLTYPANDSGMTVLAALAHERGHVLWWETYVPKPGGPYVPNPNFCNNIFYPPGWWNAPIDVPNNRWIGFAEIRSGYIMPGSDIDNLGTYLSQNDKRALQYLDSIYASKKWASVLAAFSPDEEFVEAYQMFALADGNVKLKRLEIVIPGQNKHDLAATLDPQSGVFNQKSVLYNQTQCF